MISDEYGLDLMLDEMQAEKGKFYVRMSDNLDLEYTVINPKGEKVINKITKEELRNDLFLIEEEFTQLSQDFDPKKLKKYLPEILNITSERGHTPSNANANYPTLKGKYYSTLLEAYAKEYITYYESKPSPFKTAVDKSVGIYLEEKINKWKKDHKITKLANNPVLTKAQELSRQYILEEIAVFMSLLLELWLQTDETTHYLAYPGQTLPALTEACKQLKNICQNTEGLKSLNLNKDLELQVISFKIEKTKGNQRTFVPTVNNISFFQNLNTSHPSSYPPASAPPTASHLERTHSHTYFPKLSPQNGERRKKIEQQEVERLKQLLFMFSKETGNCIETLEKQIQNGSSIEDSPQAFSKEHIGQDESTEYSPKYRGK